MPKATSFRQPQDGTKCISKRVAVDCAISFDELFYDFLINRTENTYISPYMHIYTYAYKRKTQFYIQLSTRIICIYIYNMYIYAYW